jgi:hypothetical protein
MTGQMRLNRLPDGYGSFEVGFHGRCEVIKGHSGTLHAFVHAVIEHQDIHAPLHPGMLSQKADFTAVSAINLDRKGVVPSLANGVHHHLSGF